MEEKFIQCPYCLENVSILLDTGAQSNVNMVDDCEVCCRPIEISYIVEEGVVSSLSYNTMEGNEN